MLKKLSKLNLFIIIIFFYQVSYAATVQYEIYWTGGSGYSMDGNFSFDNSLKNTGLINANSLQSFYIEGYLDGESMGSWNYFTDPLTGIFYFNFDTNTEKFLTGGHSSSEMGQTWNTSTGGSSCGEFGFTSGSFAQGVCIQDDLKSPDSYVYMPQSTLIAVQTVPVPASVWLFTSSLIGLAGVKRKKLKTTCGPKPKNKDFS